MHFPTPAILSSLTAAACRGSLAVVPSSGKCRKSSWKMSREKTGRSWPSTVYWSLPWPGLELLELATGQPGQPAYRIVLMCCSFYSKSISKDIQNVGNVGLRVPREKNVGLRCWPAIVILTHPFPLASPQFQEGAKMHPGSCRCLIVQNYL